MRLGSYFSVSLPAQQALCDSFRTFCEALHKPNPLHLVSRPFLWSRDWCNQSPGPCFEHKSAIGEFFWQSIIPTHSSRFNTLLLPYFYVDLSNNPSLSNKLLPPIRNLRIFYNRAKFFICKDFAMNIPSTLNSIHVVIEMFCYIPHTWLHNAN